MPFKLWRKLVLPAPIFASEPVPSTSCRAPSRPAGRPPKAKSSPIVSSMLMMPTFKSPKARSGRANNKTCATYSTLSKTGSGAPNMFNISKKGHKVGGARHSPHMCVCVCATLALGLCAILPPADLVCLPRAAGQ